MTLVVTFLEICIYKYFFFFSNDQFQSKLFFCWYCERDLLSGTECGNDWWGNYERWTGTKESTGALPLYAYFDNRPDKLTTDLFVRKDLKLEHVDPYSLEFQRTIWIPGIGD